jgi:hypothetical protein
LGWASDEDNEAASRQIGCKRSLCGGLCLSCVKLICIHVYKSRQRSPLRARALAGTSTTDLVEHVLDHLREQRPSHGLSQRRVRKYNATGGRHSWALIAGSLTKNNSVKRHGRITLETFQPILTTCEIIAGDGEQGRQWATK